MKNFILFILLVVLSINTYAQDTLTVNVQSGCKNSTVKEVNLLLRSSTGATLQTFSTITPTVAQNTADVYWGGFTPFANDPNSYYTVFGSLNPDVSLVEVNTVFECSGGLYESSTNTSVFIDKIPNQITYGMDYTSDSTQFCFYQDSAGIQTSLSCFDCKEDVVDTNTTYTLSAPVTVGGTTTYILTDSDGNDQTISFTDTDTQRTDAEICAAVAANCNAEFVDNEDGTYTFIDNAGNPTTVTIESNVYRFGIDPANPDSVGLSENGTQVEGQLCVDNTEIDFLIVAGDTCGKIYTYTHIDCSVEIDTFPVWEENHGRTIYVATTGNDLAAKMGYEHKTWESANIEAWEPQIQSGDHVNIKHGDYLINNSNVNRREGSWVKYNDISVDIEGDSELTFLNAGWVAADRDISDSYPTPVDFSLNGPSASIIMNNAVFGFQNYRVGSKMDIKLHSYTNKRKAGEFALAGGQIFYAEVDQMRIENSNTSFRTNSAKLAGHADAPSIDTYVNIKVKNLYQTNNDVTNQNGAVKLAEGFIENSNNNFHTINVDNFEIDGSLTQFSIQFFAPGIDSYLEYRGRKIEDKTPIRILTTDPYTGIFPYTGITLSPGPRTTFNSTIKLNLEEYKGNKPLGANFTYADGSPMVYDSCVIHFSIDDYRTGENPLVHLRSIDLKNNSKLILEFKDGLCDNYAISLAGVTKDATSEIIIRNSTLRANKTGVAVIYSNSDIILDNVTLINDGVTAPISSNVPINVTVKDAYANSLTVDPNVTELVEPITRDTNVK